MQWYMIPIRKMPSVLRVRQTYPNGHILLMQKSMTPRAYKIDRIKVPEQTRVEP